MGLRADEFAQLFRSSRAIGKYREHWTPLRGRLLQGSLLVIRSTVLNAPGDDGAHAIASHVLQRLFGYQQVDALGGLRAAPVLAGLLQQFASEDPNKIVVLMATPRSLQLMRKGGGQHESRVVQKPFQMVQTLDPILPMYGVGPREGLILPRLWGQRRRCPIRIGHYERLARPCLVKTDERAVRKGHTSYRAEQTLFIYGTDDDMPRVRMGTLSAPHVPRRCLDDGAVLTIDLPTLMVYQLRPRGTRYSNMRLGINFSPGGEYVIALSTKIGDFEEYLDFFAPEFERAMRSVLMK